MGKKREKKEEGTCGLKVVVLDEMTTILVVTALTAEEKKRGYRKIIIMKHTHTHTKVLPVSLPNARSMHGVHAQH